MFRARPESEGRWLIVKTGDADQLAVQAQRLRQVWRGLKDHPRARVPQLFHQMPGVLVMEDALSRPMAALWREGLGQAAQAGQLGRAGEWIAAFHALTQDIVPFDPQPHLRWLARLTGVPPALQALADQAAGRPVLRAVTHRDLHLGNLILRGNGRIYGIDFENRRPDVALRDPLMLLMDAALQGAIAAEDLAAAAKALNLPPAPDPAPALFFQRFLAEAQITRMAEAEGLAALQRRALWLWLRNCDQALF